MVVDVGYKVTFLRAKCTIYSLAIKHNVGCVVDTLPAKRRFAPCDLTLSRDPRNSNVCQYGSQLCWISVSVFRQGVRRPPLPPPPPPPSPVATRPSLERQLPLSAVTAQSLAPPEGSSQRQIWTSAHSWPPAVCRKSAGQGRQPPYEDQAAQSEAAGAGRGSVEVDRHSLSADRLPLPRREHPSPTDNLPPPGAGRPVVVRCSPDQ